MAMRPRYRSNPVVSWKHRHGEKVVDEISGHRSYEDLTVLDDDGNRVITRNRRTYDRRYDLQDDGDERSQG